MERAIYALAAALAVLAAAVYFGPGRYSIAASGNELYVQDTRAGRVWYAKPNIAPDRQFGKRGAGVLDSAFRELRFDREEIAGQEELRRQSSTERMESSEAEARCKALHSGNEEEQLSCLYDAILSDAQEKQAIPHPNSVGKK